MVPPVMMQQIPPMATPIQVMPVQVHSPRQNNRQELSTSAATKTGAAVFGLLGLFRAAISLPILHSLSRAMLPGEVNRQSAAYIKQMSSVEAGKFLSQVSHTSKSALAAIFVLAGLLYVGFMTGVGALLGNITASAYNHFSRKENSRPRYF